MCLCACGDLGARLPSTRAARAHRGTLEIAPGAIALVQLTVFK
jgi:hypothetical protein